MCLHGAVCWIQQVEVKLKKAEGWRWEKLENDGVASVPKQFDPGKLHPFVHSLLVLVKQFSLLSI